MHRQAYREGRLCDNLPKLILHNLNQFTPEVREKIAQSAAESKTGWLDTHPAQTDRIASARKEAAAGIFRLEMPASALFSDYDRQGQHVTWEFYLQIFGNQLKREDIHPVDELLKRQEQELQAFQALHRYLQGTFRGDRPLRLPSWRLDLPDDIQATVQQVQDTRTQLMQGAPKYNQQHAEFETAPVGNREILAPQLAHFETLVGQRLAAALSLLQAADIGGQIERADHYRDGSAMLLPVLQQLELGLDSTKRLVHGNRQLAELFEQLSRDNHDQSALDSLRQQMHQSRRLISDVRKDLKAFEYPFDHAKGKISLAEFAVGELPDAENPGEIYAAASNVIESTSRLRARLTGQLCLIAEQVELALGLQPLDEPTRDEAETSPKSPKEDTSPRESPKEDSSLKEDTDLADGE